MKNALLALVALVGLGISAQAQIHVDAQATRTIVPNKTSCSSTTLAASATEITGNVAVAPFTTPGVYEIQVMTLSSSATAYFSDNVAVSTFNAQIGVPVYPSVSGQPSFVPFVINPTQLFYGVSGTAGQNVIICKKR